MMSPVPRTLLSAGITAVLLLGAISAAALESAAMRATHSSARLVTPNDGVRPGDEIRVGVFFELDPGWHVYWQNPGESGEPPRLRWKLPDGYAAGEPSWPVPKRFVVGGVVNYGYETDLLLVQNLRGATPLGRTSIDLELALSWLACREDECIPAGAELALAIPVLAREARADPRWAERFADAEEATPPAVDAALYAEDPDTLVVEIRGAPDRLLGATAVDVFIREPGIVDEGADARVSRDAGSLRLELTRAAAAPAAVERLSGLVVSAAPRGRAALAFEATPLSEAAAPPGDAPAFDTLTWRWALLFAFLGGLLLNLMPCVFPVLSLKVLGFVERAHGDVRATRLHGWAFTLGVLLSFWVLAGSLLAVRAGGQQLGWGFQLQSPLFVAMLVYLLVAMALSFGGLFEFGTSLTGALGRVGTEEGLAGSFWTGALATVVATPCTAPFMGPALGFALAQPPAVAMAVFSLLGLGMALPYLVLSHAPGALAKLPRPGPWMERLRQAMAFPLLATAVWLTDVFRAQTGDGAVIRLLAGLLALALGLWLWGIASGAARRAGLVRLSSLALAAVALAVGVGAARDVKPPRAEVATSPEGFWQPWSQQQVEDFRRGGHAVFVNFTAAWCLTCKVNERAVFARSDVRNLFARYDVAALEADWTNENPEIQSALASFGRDGVPLYVYYPADPAAPPIVLPQIPTYEDLENAFRDHG